jgi:hypothetical protein
LLRISSKETDALREYHGRSIADYLAKRLPAIPQGNGENQDRAMAPCPSRKKRQPVLLQRTMRLNKEPGKMVEGWGIC